MLAGKLSLDTASLFAGMEIHVQVSKHNKICVGKLCKLHCIFKITLLQLQFTVKFAILQSKM